ncbi:MAG: ribokinase [Armatimonadetes bacterium]|nr:ribokinase [Armatimonadota bacterium]
MSPRVLVVGSINMDMFARVDEFPKAGETVIGSDFFNMVGGKGCNQAITIAGLGCQASFVARVGSDSFGEQMLAVLRESGVDTTFVARDGGSPSGVALVNVDRTGENTVVVIPGANQLLSEDDVSKLESEISSASVLVAQLEIPLETVEAALQIANRHGVKTILNPAPARGLSRGLLRMVDVLTPNSSELEGLLDTRISDDADMERACRVLLEDGVKAVVVTLGGEGVLVATKKGCRRYPALRVNVVDTSGAGDAFTGALAAYLAEGADLDRAVQQAIGVASYSVTKPGARPSLPTREELETFVQIHS